MITYDSQYIQKKNKKTKKTSHHDTKHSEKVSLIS